MRHALVLLAACHDPVSARSASVGDYASDVVATVPAPAPPPVEQPPCAGAVRLGDGLTHERHTLDALPAADVEPCIDVVRADLARYRLRVLTKASAGTSQPAPQWRERYKLVAVTNAGMFHAEGRPVGLIVEDGVAHAKDNKKFGGYLAWDPRSPSDPSVVITGRDCDGFDLGALRARYRSILQSNRLLGCSGEALPWKDQKQYSAAAIGLDRAGRVVFIHARAPVRMTELAQSVAALGMTGAMFLEGGPEASLVVRGSEGELARVGSYETGFVENDENHSFWWLPNVIALEARD